MIRFVEKTISPDEAKKILSNMKKNRPVSKDTINRYANDMQNGLWISRTGETIKLNTLGELIDGQHRLLAVIKSGKKICFTFAEKCEDEVFSVIDNGRLRSIANVLQMAGGKNTTLLGSAIALILRFNDDCFFSTSKKSYSNAELLLYYENHKEIHHYSNEINAMRTNKNSIKGLSNSILLSLYYLCDDHKQKDFYKYCEGLFFGNNLSKKDPRLVVRNAIFNNKLNTISGNAHQYEMKYIIVNAWNRFIVGNPMTKIDLSRPETTLYINKKV